MQCPQCRHENLPVQKFCGECGARLSLTCAGCGASNPPAQKFCGECGARLFEQDGAPPKPVSPESYTPKHLAEKILASKAALDRKSVV